MCANDDGTNIVYDVVSVTGLWSKNALAEMENYSVKKIFLGKFTTWFHWYSIIYNKTQR